jgi:hypothetical protein
VSSPTDTPSGRTRRTRRPLPALIFLLVLAIAALGVWWQVLRQDDHLQSAQAASCSTASAAPPSVQPSSVTVTVLNASNVAGKASEVSTTMQSRGFQMGKPDNDRSGQQVTGVGQVRYGPAGKQIARFVALYLPGAKLVQDTRADKSVDLVLGPDFKGLASQEDVTSRLAAAASASAVC